MKSYLFLFLMFFIDKTFLMAFSKFQELREQRIFTDIDLISDDNVEFPCHKVILSSNSYFEKMLTSNMKESKQNKIYLSYSKETVNLILNFVYTPNLSSFSTSIPLKLYVELLDFSKQAFMDNLSKAILKAPIDIEKENLRYLSDIAIKYEDKHLIDCLFEPLNKKKFEAINKFIKKSTGPFRLPHSSFTAEDSYLIVSIFKDALVCKINKVQKPIMLPLDTSHEIHIIQPSINGAMLFLARDEKCEIWDVYNLKRISIIERNTEPIKIVCFSKDCTLLIIAGCVNASIWDVSKGQKLFSLPDHGYINAVSFSNDGNLIATASNKKVRIWDFHIQKELFNFDGVDFVTSIDFTKDDTHIIIVAHRIVEIRKIDSKYESRNYIGGLSEIGRVQFMNDDVFMIIRSGSYKSSIQMWDDFKEILETREQDDRIQKFDYFSSDGIRLICGNYNNLLVFILPPIELLSNRAIFKSSEPLWFMLKYNLLTYMENSENFNYDEFLNQEYMQDKELLQFIENLYENNQHFKTYVEAMFS